MDGRGNQNPEQDCRYYVASRTNTTLRIKSTPLGFGWGGRGNGVDGRGNENATRDC